MKSKNLTFDRFTWLDFRTTIASSTSVNKTNPIGFQELYWKIHSWIIHPIKNINSEVATKSWRMFKVKNKAFIMTTTWLDEINIGWTITNRVTQAFADKKDYRKVMEVKWKASSSTASWNCDTDSESTFIKSATTLGSNVYAGLLVELFTWSTSKWVYYINSNDADTIFIEWSLDYIPWASDTFQIYLPVDYVLVYDWTTARIYNRGSSYSSVDTFSLSNWFLALWNNRLLKIEWKKVTFTTINHWWYFPYLNYIYTEWDVSDIQSFWTQLYIFTQKGTYSLQWTWYQTIAMPKFNEYATYNMIYPVIYDWRLFISDNWKISPFDQSKWLEYNYKLIPDTSWRIFSIDDWIVFSLWHSLSKYWLINIEEIKNEQMISITNYLDWSLEDIINFDNKIYAIIGWKLYKDSANLPISLKTNKLDYNAKLFFDKLTMITSGTNPTTITYNVWGTDTSVTKVTTGRDERYPILKRSDNIVLSFTTTEAIQSFTLSIKI